MVTPALKFLLLMLVIILFAIVFMLTTPQGLKLACQLASAVSGGKLNIEKCSGRLISQFDLQKITFKTDAQIIKIDDFSFKWQAKKLLSKQLNIEKSVIDNIHIKLIKQKQKPKKEVTEGFTPPTNIQLPLSIHLLK